MNSIRTANQIQMLSFRRYIESIVRLWDRSIDPSFRLVLCFQYTKMFSERLRLPQEEPKEDEEQKKIGILQDQCGLRSVQWTIFSFRLFCRLGLWAERNNDKDGNDD